MTCEEAKLIAEILGDKVPTKECPQEEQAEDRRAEEPDGDLSDAA